jgi:hypothetical protein
MRVCANPHIFFTYTLYGMVPSKSKTLLKKGIKYLLTYFPKTENFPKYGKKHNCSNFTKPLLTWYICFWHDNIIIICI